MSAVGEEQPGRLKPGINSLIRFEIVGKNAEKVSIDGGRRVDHPASKIMASPCLQQKKNAMSRRTVAWAVE